MTSRSQPAGSGCGASSSSVAYDGQANVTSDVDFADHRTCYVYDLARNLETVRLQGLASADSCPANLASYVIPAGLPADKPQRKITTAWHPQWRMKSRRAEPRLISIWVYNGQPDPSNGNTIISCAPAAAKLPDNNPIAVLCKKIEQSTTDKDGNQGFSATAEGAARIWSYTYNAFGQKLTEDSPRTDVTDVTTWAYYPDTSTVVGSEHTKGDLKSMTDALGRKTDYLRYDRAGRVLKSVQPNGVVTEIIYTPRGWVDTVTLTPNGSGAAQLTDYDYWPTGLLKKVTQPDGSWLSYIYDGAHRLTDVSDNLGNTVHYTLDDIGNRKQEDYKDPAGALAKSIKRVYDPLNRPQTLTGAVQ